VEHSALPVLRSWSDLLTANDPAPKGILDALCLRGREGLLRSVAF